MKAKKSPCVCCSNDEHYPLYSYQCTCGNKNRMDTAAQWCQSMNNKSEADLVKQLRSYDYTSGYSSTMRKAADVIEALEKACKVVVLGYEGGVGYKLRQVENARPLLEKALSKLYGKPYTTGIE